ncbi:MAG: hypothetical protein ACLFUW_00400 [Bacteroidales bacterium]
METATQMLIQDLRELSEEMYQYSEGSDLDPFYKKKIKIFCFDLHILVDAFAIDPEEDKLARIKQIKGITKDNYLFLKKDSEYKLIDPETINRFLFKIENKLDALEIAFDEDPEIDFGRHKGKKVSSLSDEDLLMLYASGELDQFYNILIAKKVDRYLTRTIPLRRFHKIEEQNKGETYESITRNK